MIVDNQENEPDDDLAEVAAYFLENDNFVDDDFDDFDTWLCELLDFSDNYNNNSVNAITPGYSPQIDPYAIKESIPELQATLSDFPFHSVFQIVKHLLLDTGSPKDITPESWLHNANWTPVRKISLPTHIKPFRFAGQYVHALYAACLIATITIIHGNEHLFRQVAFILPNIPIPFLVGLQTQRSLAFDICLRQGPGSHRKINKFRKLFLLFLQSHVWLQFTPCNQDPEPNFDWTPLITNALDFHPNPTNYAYPISTHLAVNQASSPYMALSTDTFNISNYDNNTPTLTTTCLIKGTDNPADAMTKEKPNMKLEVVLKFNTCHTPAKRVFMLQTSNWRHKTWIPTSKVPMPDDPKIATCRDVATVSQ